MAVVTALVRLRPCHHASLPLAAKYRRGIPPSGGTPTGCHNAAVRPLLTVLSIAKCELRFRSDLVKQEGRTWIVLFMFERRLRLPRQYV